MTRDDERPSGGSDGQKQEVKWAVGIFISISLYIYIKTFARKYVKKCRMTSKDNHLGSFQNVSDWYRWSFAAYFGILLLARLCSLES